MCWLLFKLRGHGAVAGTIKGADMYIEILEVAGGWNVSYDTEEGSRATTFISIEDGGKALGEFITRLTGGE